MSALARPDIPPGPHRDLNDALHDLHHHAGRPSLRTLARHAGCSPTTVSAAFSTTRLPSWGLLELLVEAMHGDTTHFHQLWLTASNGTAATATAARTAPPIAGRRDELTAVRRHLETGTGLLLVTGEAGIGKTTLVTTAAQTTDTFVATGHCLPLSTEVPLLPVAEALRSIHERDDGQWFKDALADCPGYVAAALPRVLPDLSPVGIVDTALAGSLLQLFGAIATALTRLAELRPLALLVEDLHWADSTTLDLLEQVASHPRPPRLVATWRLDDPSTSEERREWLTRLLRSRTTAAVELSPLTIEETAEQLRLVTGVEPDPGQVAGIHSRSAGHPLFTEQLATQAGDEDLPRLLGDLLDHRLGVLAGDEWLVARALGIADRALDHPVLLQTTGLPVDDLTAALRALHRRRLASPTASEVQLSHPLLAEAVRRRIMPGEAAEEHRRLARALAAGPRSSASEVAAHWQAAGDGAEELVWRVRAARDAAHRFAASSEAEEWIRVLDLMHRGHACPGVTEYDAVLGATAALVAAGRMALALELVEGAIDSLLPGLGSDQAARLYARAGYYRGETVDTGEGLALLERALALYAGLPPDPLHVDALELKAQELASIGRYPEALEVVHQALAVAEELGEPRLRRGILPTVAWHEALAGDLAGALGRLEEAERLRAPEPDPHLELWIATCHTDLLLIHACPADEVEASALRALDVCEELGIRSTHAVLIRANVAEAWLRAGRPATARALLQVGRGDEISHETAALHILLARLDTMLGRHGDAASRLEAVRAVRLTWLAHQAALAEATAESHLWQGRPEPAYSQVLPVLRSLADSSESRLAARLFALAARAAVDRGEAGELEALRRRALVDPLGPGGVPGDRRAATTAWTAELARASHSDSSRQWVAAAEEWDRIGRPHDAAYCRWRAAQVALRDGQGTAATQLLRRAARDAREHVPLSAAIAETAAYAGRS